MDIWTFIIILVVIGTFKDVIKIKYQRSNSDKTTKTYEQEIHDLKKRICSIEKRHDIEKIEKRLQALETIVVDSDYQLDMKFKRELEDKTNEYKRI